MKRLVICLLIILLTTTQTYASWSDIKKKALEEDKKPIPMKDKER